jgi:phage terminase large subunit-like protein
MSWDTALMDGGQSDWTVCTIWMLLGGIYYLLHVERGIYEYPELRRYSSISYKNNPYQIQIEETAIGKALKNDRDLPALIKTSVRSNKTERPLYTAGQV